MNFLTRSRFMAALPTSESRRKIRDDFIPMPAALVFALACFADLVATWTRGRTTAHEAHPKLS